MDELADFNSAENGPTAGALLLDADQDDSKSAFGVYKRRFWILFLLTLVSMQQSVVTITFSPIVDECKTVYGWDSGTVDMFASLGNVVYVSVVMLTPDVVERIGLRASITLAAVLTGASAVMRVFTTAAPYAVILAYTSQVLNAISAVLVCATPSKLSAEWFAPHERVTATSVAVMANYAGNCKAMHRHVIT